MKKILQTIVSFLPSENLESFFKPQTLKTLIRQCTYELNSFCKSGEYIEQDFQLTGNFMSDSYNVQELKAQLLLNLRSCLLYLLPNGTFHKNEFQVGDIWGNKGKSLRVELSGSRAGLWNDFATGEGGDIITAIKLRKKWSKTELKS